MKIIGIDIAPSKPSHIFCSGGPHEKKACQLSEFLDELSALDEDVLICWDSPLTGTPDPDSDRFRNGDHTQRRIEAFFNRGEWGFKVPKGISVLGFSGCSHWAISRRLVGLPRVGRWDRTWDDLPFKLVSEGNCPTGPGHYIVEVHPAVALWLWCRCNTSDRTEGWEYKKNNDVLERMWKELYKRFSDVLLPSGASLSDSGFEPENDDELDCFVAWLLGVLWCRESDEVILLGNRATGSMLLPNVEGLQEQFLKSLDVDPGRDDVPLSRHQS